MRNLAFAAMPSVREAVETYVRAKDENRPYLMARAFRIDSTVEVVVTSGTISFPPLTLGLESISDVLVRQFARTYENVHTFCLCPPPTGSPRVFCCKWLVGMSEKDSRNVRVGYGRYEWHFDAREPRRVERLVITIEHMETLPPSFLLQLVGWLEPLDYPWCPPSIALATLPVVESLQPIRRGLEQACAETPASDGDLCSSLDA